MKKSKTGYLDFLKRLTSAHFFKVMRLTVFLILVGISNIFASSTYSQSTKFTFELRNISLEQLFEEIQSQSEFNIFYKNSQVDKSIKVSITANEASVEDVLTQAFMGLQLDFKVIDRQIVIFPQKELPEETKVEEAELQKPEEKSISGEVSDSNGLPLPGVTIVVAGTTIGTVTDESGKYTLKIPTDTQTLQFSFVGMRTQDVSIAGQSVINVTMVEDAIGIEEVVAVGYGTQKKVNLTGAISVIGSEKLESTKNQNVQNMLTGKLPGVRVVQKTSEPGNFNNLFDIRGFGEPLLIIDGVPRGMGEFQRMDPSDIESVSVLKDASAAIYGVRSSNGVVLVTTKSGHKGKAEFEYSMYYGLQFPAEVLVPVGAFDRMTLMNEKYMRNQSDPVLKYFDEDFEKLANGETKSYDWYNAVIRDAAPQQQHNISARGGSDKVDYYLNFGYTSQDGFFRSGDMTYDRYNVRSNINAKLNDRFDLSVRLSGAVDKRNRPQLDAWETFSALWRTPTTMPIYANDNPQYFQEVPNTRNAVALTNADITGYKISENKIFQSSFEANYKVPNIDGLTAKALFSYDNTFFDNTNFTKKFSLYNYSGSGTYDEQTYNDVHNLQRQYGNSIGKTWNVSLNYEKLLAKNHNVKGVLVYEEVYTKGLSFSAQRELNMPLPYLDLGTSVQYATGGAPGEYSRKGLVGRFNYDYKGKYFFVGNFRYDGSSRFIPGNQWDLFYSVEGAWRISEENFIKNNFDFVDNIKLRATYGRLGDDSANMWEFLGGYDYGTSGGATNNYPKAYDLGSGFVPALSTRATPNYNIGWFDIYSGNLGLDVDMWNGKLGVVFEMFQRDRDGLYATRSATLPGTFGASMPQENLNSDRTKGFEIELKHRNKIGGFVYNVSGNMTITRGMKITNIHTPYGNSLDEWRNTQSNRYDNVWFGYGVDGRYQSYEDKATYPVFTDPGKLPGDVILEDWNNDGSIDGDDMHPIATTGDRPLMTFALSSNLSYKGFDLDFMFQGAALHYTSYGAQLVSPLAWDGNALPYLLDRWHPVDPKKDPYDPTSEWVSGYFQYGGIGGEENSSYRIQNGAYLRLKSITLGYTLPKKLLGKTGINNVRLYTSAYNVLTITKVIGVDPEKPSDQDGAMYPLNQTINFGASIKF